MSANEGRFQTPVLALSMPAETRYQGQGDFGEWKGNLIAVLPSQGLCTVIRKAM